MAQTVRNLPAMRETQVRYLGQEDPLIKIMDTYFSTLVWRILWIAEPGGLQIMVLQRVRHNRATNIFTFSFHSQLYMTTGKTIALTTWTFVHKLISLLLKYAA